MPLLPFLLLASLLVFSFPLFPSLRNLLVWQGILEFGSIKKNSKLFYVSCAFTLCEIGNQSLIMHYRRRVFEYL